MTSMRMRFVQVAVLAAMLIAAVSFTVQAQDESPADPAAGGRTYRQFMPMVLHVPPPPSPLRNGNFEAGRADWAESSARGLSIIRRDFVGSVTAHSGSWAAWLGGVSNENSSISQQVTVPAAAPVLTYWYWSASADFCGYDQFSVRVGNTVVRSYYLCNSANTNGWRQQTVNLSAYAGQKVTLQFRVTTDGSYNSNYFLDDVTFQSAAAALAEEAAVTDDLSAAAGPGADLGKLPGEVEDSPAGK